MLNWIALLWACLPKFKSQQDRDEAYLNDAVDVYDLERRMHDIDRRNDTYGAFTLRFGMEKY